MGEWMIPKMAETLWITDILIQEDDLVVKNVT